MMRRIPQPPVDPSRRRTEAHALGPGLVGALIGLALLAFGLRHSTGVETVDGGMAWETQLVKAYSSGGLQYPEQTVSAPPSSDDPGALDRWARQSVRAKPPAWKLRVDTAAKTPCPT